MRSIAVFFVLAAAITAGVDVELASGQELTRTAAVVQHQAPEYQVGPGDVLSIRVSGLREFELSARVSNSGRIRVPYVGVMLAAGMTSFEIEREVARLIKEHELIIEPSVRVQVDQYRARPTYVIGEVNTPGQFMITGEMYLLDLISKAGGLRPSANRTGYLYRRRMVQPSVETRIVGDESGAPVSLVVPPVGKPQPPENSPTEEVVKVDFNELREGIRPELNLSLQGGDILYVPRVLPNNIFVIGDVKVPGMYTLPRIGQITAAQAIIYAGGPLATANTGKGFLMRHDESGVRQAKPVDFAAILKGDEPDIAIQPNDIIFIPNSTAKTIGVGFLNMVPNLISQFLIF